jgi:glycosyltransferase involved in cell wall biosynthesis
MNPEVTVVIPTYNRLAFLMRAIESCTAQSDGVSVEVIVIDDGSTDGSADRVEQLRAPGVRLLRQAHQGPQAARNRGLAEARGQFIKFLDDDDWLEAGALRQELGGARAVGADICSGDVAVVDEGGRLIQNFPAAKGSDLFIELVRGTTTTHPLRFLVRKELAQSVAWNPAIGIRQDVDYFFRIGLHAAKHVTVATNVGSFRQHPQARVSTNPGLAGPRQQLRILMNIGEDPAERPNLARAGRVDALREGLWRAAHHCAVFDWPAAVAGWKLGDRLGKTKYIPERSHSLMKVSDALLGAQTTERLLLWPRRWRTGLRRQPPARTSSVRTNSN